jgi:hypothetical protein
MVTHRFAEAAEKGDRPAMAARFAEDVTYHSPTLTPDLHGKALTLRYLAMADVVPVRTRQLDDRKAPPPDPDGPR